MKYVDVEVARASRGVRVVLTQGFPGPWGQAVKKMLEYKGIDYVPVAQFAGQDNASLKSWVGVRNAPVIVNEDERPLTTSSEAILFAERRKPSPALLPPESESRALMFGLIHELAQENGFGWCMRLMLLKGALDTNPAARDQAIMKQMMTDYRYTEAAVQAAPGRVIDILGMLTRRLAAQQAQGSDYFVGTGVTAADIYWACFSIMVERLPDALCPMSSEARRSSTPAHPGIIAAAAPILIEHRNRMFERFLGPLEF